MGKRGHRGAQRVRSELLHVVAVTGSTRWEEHRSDPPLCHGTATCNVTVVPVGGHTGS